MTEKNVDWSKCVICQQVTNDSLQCPATARNTQNVFENSYMSFEADIKGYKEYNKSVKDHIETLLGVGDIVSTLSLNKAKWHKLCRNKIAKWKRQQSGKRVNLSSVSDVSFTTPAKQTRLNTGSATKISPGQCFFCGKANGQLHQVTTFEMGEKVQQYALDIQDTVLLAKLSAGDLISQEALYHLKCYRDLFHKARDELDDTESENNGCRQIHGIVLAELVSYIEDSRLESKTLPVFKLCDIVKLYKERLLQFGIEEDVYVHSSKLKDRIIQAIPELQSHKQGRDIYLAYREDVANVIKRVAEHDYDNEGMILAKAAKIVRQELLNQIPNQFSGSFQAKCQEQSVPQSLKTLVEMILSGPEIPTESETVTESQAALTISQLLKFNTSVRRRKNSSGTYNSRKRECPLPMYIGLVLHAETRRRGLIDKLHNLGLSISYNRVLEISTQLGNHVCDRYEETGVVCPPNLKTGLFTTAAVDNIDHNPSSTTAQGSFHGTGISLFQHRTDLNDGQAQQSTPLADTQSSKQDRLKQLPDYYKCVHPVGIPTKPPNVPSTGPLVVPYETLRTATESQQIWLEHVRKHLQEEEIGPDVQLSWSGYHADLMLKSAKHITVPDLTALLPLFEEQAKSHSMIKHSMTVVANAVQYLNPGQTPVIACDQPLYALAKQIQWTWPEDLGEGKYVVLLGGLHIEMAALKTLGDWLDNSGWTAALEQANIATSGKADSFLKATHLGRTRHAHQVTACALYVLMHKAFVAEDRNDTTTIEAWRVQRESESPQFHFWSMTLRLEVAVLLFVKALREGNFQLYIESLAKIAPWFFALDHPNYARWLPVHVRDMLDLQRNDPDVAEHFRNGCFVFNKTSHCFSAMPIDQAHEQNNKLVKDEGGAIGLTENPMQLLRWMISGPEIAQLVKEFETTLTQSNMKSDSVLHHEQTKGTQTQFRQQVIDLCASFVDLGNPFEEYSQDLLAIGTNDIADDKVKDTVRRIEQLGIDQYNTYVSERLQSTSKHIMEPIKQNKLALFSRQSTKGVITGSKKLQIASLKQNCTLFSQLYISCQVREGNLDEFFAHENTSFPPALSQFGQLRFGTKSDLLGCLETVEMAHVKKPPVDALVMDGAVIVNMLKPSGCVTFKDYAEKVFVPYIQSQLVSVQRLDLVFDQYIEGSLKASARAKRGQGMRRRVNAESRVPKQWHNFLREDENKAELFHYLAEYAIADVEKTAVVEGKQVISTKGVQVLNVLPDANIHELAPCSHEEADTRILLHVEHAGRHGLKRVMIRTMDTDVLVLAIGTYSKLSLEELWVSFGTGKGLKYFPVHTIATRLGDDRARALPGFHAFTGCDQTSSFAGKGKKTAWDTWLNFDGVTTAFELMTCLPSSTTLTTIMPSLERFVVLMYDKTSVFNSVNETRKLLFTRKGRSIDNIPPTSAALSEHVKRSIFQAGFHWGQSLEQSPSIPSPSEWGWQKGESGNWEPFWSRLPHASACCQELLRCKCKPETGCRGWCKCVRADMVCTALCQCGGSCDRV